MKKFIFIIMISISLISLAKDDYTLNANRINKVFSQWELLTSRKTKILILI